MRSTWWLATAVVAALVLTGCGGGDGVGSSSQATSGPTATPTPSATVPDTRVADAYRDGLAALCDEQRRAARALPDAGTPAEAIDVLEQGVPIVAAAVAQEAMLVPPPELAAVHALAAAKRAALLELIGSTVSRARAGEDAATVLTQSQPRLDALRADLDRLALEAGVPECAAEPAASATSPSTAPAPDTTDTSTTVSTAGDAEIERFEADVAAAERALARAGAALAETATTGLRVHAPAFRADHEDFAAAISRMDTYVLANEAAETRRARLVAEAPPVGDLLRSFADAVTAGDQAEARRLRPHLRVAMSSFSATAHPRSS